MLPGELWIDCYSFSLCAKQLSVSLGIPVEDFVCHKITIAVNLELTWQYPLSEFVKNKQGLFV